MRFFAGLTLEQTAEYAQHVSPSTAKRAWRLDAAKRQAAVQFYGDETMKMLRDAVGKGYTYAGHSARDPALDPLRDRGDFKKLIQELEKNSTTGPETR